jgi:cellulose biosynthesis protein BcsQ
MVNIEHREEKMRNVLSKIKNQYEFIIIDCSPSLGLITINSLTAADSVLIPVQCEYFALEGLGKLLNTIKIIPSRRVGLKRIRGPTAAILRRRAFGCMWNAMNRPQWRYGIIYW